MHADPIAAKSDIYQQHLDLVSRSFAFCIRELGEPLRSRVSLAYLICRILDTIEDSQFSEIEIKLAQMKRFNVFLRTPPKIEVLHKWLARLPVPETDGERRLLEQSSSILSDLHALPEPERQVIQDAVLSMSNGMAYYLRRSNGSGGAIRLTSMGEVNRYCFFVAGVVGEMLSRLFSVMRPGFAVDSERLLLSHQFGLFLQKINILKDQLEDEKQGRFLVPSRDCLWTSLEADAEGALRYLQMIPVDARDYRLFCGWSLFLGLASIPWIKKTWARRLMHKIPRVVTERILKDVSARIDDNSALSELYSKMKQAMATNAPVFSLEDVPDDSFEEFFSLYRGRVSTEHLARLGLFEVTLSYA